MVGEETGTSEEFIRGNWNLISERNPYLQRGFDTVREYVKGNGEWKGLLLVFGDFERDFFYPDFTGFSADEIKAEKARLNAEMEKGNGVYLVKLNGDWARDLQEYEKSNGKPLLYLDSELGDLYDRMSKPGKGKDPDGAIVFSKEGYLLGAQMFVNEPNMKLVPGVTIDRIREIKKMEDDMGTKHVAAAYASLLGLPSVVGSQDAWTVIGFYGGFIPDELVYDPREQSVSYSIKTISEHEKRGKGIEQAGAV